MEHNQYISRLIKSHYNGDIRRFCLSKDCSFEDFRRSLHYLYGSIPSSYCYRYMDDENDMISITSDKELTEALRFSNPHNDTLKVFVVEKKEPTPKKMYEEIEDNEPVVEEIPLVNHEAYCDHCGEDIFGVRYKCGNCEDFDLCENCETLWSFELSIHPEDHVFLKIYTPLPSWHSGSKLMFFNLYEGSENDKVDETPESDKETENKSDDYSSNSDSDDETITTEDASSSSEDDDDDSSSSDDDDDDDDDESSSDSDDDSNSSDDDKEDKEDTFSMELQQALTEMEDFATKLQKRYLPSLTRDDETESSSSDSDTDSDGDICDEEKPAEPVIGEEPQQPIQVEVSVEEPVVNNENNKTKGGEFSSFVKNVKWFLGLGVEWESTWDELLTKAEEMGFSDKEHFRKLILDNRGDLTRAIHSHFEEQ